MTGSVGTGAGVGAGVPLDGGATDGAGVAHVATDRTPGSSRGSVAAGAGVAVGTAVGAGAGAHVGRTGAVGWPLIT